MEKEPNNDFDSPQRVELNTTIQGVAKTEDKDEGALVGIVDWLEFLNEPIK